MNHIYKKVWNRVRCCFVAVSEAISSARQKTCKATVIVGAIGLTLYTGTGWATMSTDYRENIPTGPFTSKVTAVEGEYTLNWAETVEVSGTGGLYTFIYGGRGMKSQLQHVVNNGQIYLGSWANGGIYSLKDGYVENHAGAQFHIGNYVAKAINNGFDSRPLTEEQVQTSQPEAFEISGRGNIENQGSLFNSIEVKILDEGIVTNSPNSTWQNDSVVNQTGGLVSGIGTVINQGTYNLNGGCFYSQLTGEGVFDVNVNGFFPEKVFGNVTVNIADGLEFIDPFWRNFAGGNVNNRGRLNIHYGWMNSLNNWGYASFGDDIVTFKDVKNYGTLKTLVSTDSVLFSGNFINSGNFESIHRWSFADGSRLTVTAGTVKTGSMNIFDSLGTAGQTALSKVSLQAALPEETKTALTDLFRHYVPGTVAQSLIDHATFTGGKVIVTGVNLTTTQRDDLVQAFKAKFFLPDAFTSAVSQQC